ncbi:MAG: class I SAM-dependent methyltransferase [Clostridia bacterium]|nr:class I SAM-dependent methyltransferase [Clostridia bacterium]
MTERAWEEKLKIRTAGREDAHADALHYPYEPTPYAVLERLGKSRYLTRKSRLIDYGCGKGRVGFYLRQTVGCTVTGIEYDRALWQAARDNLMRSGARGVDFICMPAERYAVGHADCFYFFNPFSVEILRAVIGKILESYYAQPRQMRLLFYYPSGDYLAWLLSQDILTLTDEIDCRDLFPGQDPREKIMVFELPGP